MTVDPERLLGTAVDAGKVGLFASLAGLAGYVGVGSILVLRVNPWPYRFLAIRTDPVLNALFAVVGASAAVTSGALVFLAGVSRTDPTDRRAVVFAGSLGVGFGASLVRVSLPVVLQYVMD